MKVGSRVTFKGDPESEVYTVAYDYTEISVGKYPRVDLTVGGWRLEGVPIRLLEEAPEPVFVGDVYRGVQTQNLYYVVDHHHDGGFWVYDANFEGEEALAVYQEKTLQYDRLYTKVRSGEEL